MWELPALGAIAAGSIYLGMPLGRSRRLSHLAQSALTGATIGILAYVAFDLFEAGVGEIGGSSAWDLSLSHPSFALFILGIATGGLLLSLFRWQINRANRPGLSGPPELSSTLTPYRPAVGRTGGLELSALTALGIGTHNLAEGIALGTAYATGIASLTVLLAAAIILHKSAEGYCICGCAPASSAQYSLPQLGALGLLAGGPTFVGTILGGSVAFNPALSVSLYGVGVGVVVSVVGLIVRSPRGRRSGRRLAGFATAAFAIVFSLGFLISGAGL